MVRKSAQLFFQRIENDVVSMTVCTDVGMEITVFNQIIKKICHHFGFDAVEYDLAPFVSVASEVCDR